MKKIQRHKHFAARTMAIVVLSFFTGWASAENAFAIDGFKDIKFGMDTKALIAMGFECTDDHGSCELKDGVTNNRTLFGQSTRIEAEYTNHIVDKIVVTIDITGDEMIKQFSSALGQPEIRDAVSLMGHRIRSFFWISKDLTSIVVTKGIDMKPMNFSMANYLSKDQTLKLLALMEGKKLDKNDF